MTLTVADLDRWDPQALRDVAAAAESRARSATEAARTLSMLPVLAGWDGFAASAARLSLDALLAELGGHAREAAVLARAAATAAEAVAGLKADLQGLEEAAHADFLDIDHERGTVVPAPGFRGAAAELAAATGPVADRLAAILEQATAVDAGLAQAISLAAETGTRPRSQTRPADLEQYGNNDTIPVAERDAVNRAVLEGDLERVTEIAAAQSIPVPDLLDDPQRYGLTDTEVTRYTNAVKVQEGLANAVLRTGAPALLWIYRPEAFGGRGRAAIAIGDPDRAADTAVLVPGTGSSVAGGWLGEDDAANLYNELTLAEPGAAHSVIAWMGYHPPVSLADPRVVQPAAARRGGALLAADVAALAATHIGPPGHVTVIGHSFGATTVADAAAGSGMRVDDVVLVGCPGTDLARTAADFHLPAGGQVYVGSSAADPVNALAGLRATVGIGGAVPLSGLPALNLGLGADPAADGFGSVRFKAEMPGWNWNPSAEHSGYFGPGSESLYSMADIVSGHGDLLEEHGMTAPHRDAALGDLAARLGLPNWSLPLTDPELGRAGTDGHEHQPIPP